jgi:hypothetical protein
MQSLSQNQLYLHIMFWNYYRNQKLERLSQIRSSEKYSEFWNGSVIYFYLKCVNPKS